MKSKLIKDYYEPSKTMVTAMLNDYFEPSFPLNPLGFFMDYLYNMEKALISQRVMAPPPI